MKHNKIKYSVMFNVFIAAFIPFVVHAGGAIQLPQTGQTTCHDVAGNVIDCVNTGQDGEIRAGIAWPSPRFTDNGNGTVTDNLTGLMWVKDGDIIKTRDPGFDADGTAGDGQVTWQHALDYIKKLNQENYLDHNDWRLPNISELASLINAGQSDNAAWLNSEGFTNVQAGSYWSSNSSYYAWYVTMGPTNYQLVDSFFKTNNRYVLSTRSTQTGTAIAALPKTGQKTCHNASGGTVIACAGTGQDGELQVGVVWPNPRFTDNGDGTAMDNLTGLIWSKDTRSPSPAACGPRTSKTWQQALDHVQCLNTNHYLGYSDWRLPNITELRSIVNQVGSSVSYLISQGFDVSPFCEGPWPYWSSDSSRSGAGALVLETCSGSNYFADKESYTGVVWPLRGGLPGQSSNNLTISTLGKGRVTTSPGGIDCGSTCSASFSTDQSVTLTATPDLGYIFAGWSGGGCSGTGTCTVTMSSARTVTAAFAGTGSTCTYSLGTQQTTADGLGATGTVSLSTI
jgi:hypothetical protein